MRLEVQLGSISSSLILTRLEVQLGLNISLLLIRLEVQLGSISSSLILTMLEVQAMCSSRSTTT
jgi:pilus assembly protein TadC